MSKDGISVIICCYNSATTIGSTLKYLFKQVNLSEIDWEIIVVNNLCTDNTPSIVTELFAENRQLNTSLVTETIPGLMAARMKGIEEAQYSLLLFCDDDNFLCKDYLYKCYQTIQDPQVGACGGEGYPVFPEGVYKPEWFDDFQGGYACGPQMRDEKQNIVMLYGAGICIKSTIFDTLSKHNFKYLLTGRKGDILLSGDDSELCFYIRMMGYKLAVVSDINFGHFIPEKRIQISYLKKMFYGFGYAVPVMDIYYAGLRDYKITSFHILKQYIKSINYFLKSWVKYKKSKSLKNLISMSVQCGVIKGYSYFKISDLVYRYCNYVSYRNK